MCCVITRSFLKHTDLNITEFLSKTLLFPEDCTSSGLSQDLFDKNKLLNMEIFSWEYTSIALFKIKIRFLESDRECLRHGSSTKPFSSHCKRDNITKKQIVWKNKFTIELWTS